MSVTRMTVMCGRGQDGLSRGGELNGTNLACNLSLLD